MSALLNSKNADLREKQKKAKTTPIIEDEERESILLEEKKQEEREKKQRKKTPPPLLPTEPEKIGSALDQELLKDIYGTAYDIQKQRQQARALQPLEIITEAPEGYYYESAAEVHDYNRQVVEYNRALREYKREIDKLYSQARSGRISIAEYDRASADYLKRLEETAPQRKEHLEYIKSLMTAGPPEPTGVIKLRQQAGLPMEGLPGPGLGPAPGSLGETLQTLVSGAVNISDRPFTAVTDPLRAISDALEKLSIDALSTTKIMEPQDVPFSMTQPVFDISQEPVYIEREPSPAVGAAAYLGSVAADVAAAGVDVATFEMRPKLIGEVGTSLIGLGVEAVTGADLGYGAPLKAEALRDPFRFMATLVGGAELGLQLKALWPRVVSKTQQVYAAREWRKLGIDESAMYPFEREIGFDFPEEVIESQTTSRMFERKTVKMRGGGVEADIPYYLETDIGQMDPDVARLLKQQISGEVPDEWKATLYAARRETALPYEYKGEGGFVKVDGVYGAMKPFKYTEPTVKEVKLPKTMLLEVKPGVDTAVKSGAFPSQQTWVTGYSEEITTYIPAMKFDSLLLKEPKVQIPNLFPNISISSLLSITGQTQKQRTALKDDFEQGKIPESLNIIAPKMGDIFKFKDIQLPKLSQIQEPEQKQIHDLKLGLIQFPKLEQIQEKIPTPIIPVPQMFEPPKKPKTKITAKPSSKKRKKKGKKRKAAAERRVDPLKLTIPDIKLNIKVPRF